MRLQPEGPPDATNRRLVEAQTPGHQPGAPVGGAFWGALQCGDHDLFHLVVTHLARRSGTWLIQQSVHPLFQKAFSPMADGLRMYMKLMRYLQIAAALGALQNDPRTQGQESCTADTPRQ